MWDLHNVDTPDEAAVLHDQLIYKRSSNGFPIPLTSVAHSGALGGGTVAVGAEDGMIRLYFPTPSLGVRGPETVPIRNSMETVVDVLAVAFTKSGDQVAACTRDGDLGTWQRDAISHAWEETLFVRLHGVDDGTPCRHLDWSLDGSLVAAGTDGNAVEVWQQVDRQWRHLMTGSVNGNVRRDPSFSHDGRYLAVTHQGGHEIEIFKMPSNSSSDPLEPEMVIQGNEDGEIKAVAWAPALLKSSSGEPALVLASSEVDGLHLWELKENSSGTGLYVAGNLVEPNRTGNFYATRLDWSPQGMLCAMAPQGKGAVFHWKEAGDGTGAWTELLEVDGHTGILGRMSWSVDGTQLAIPFEDNTVSVLSIDEGHAQASVLWQIERRCDWLQWLHANGNGEADRVACANTLGAAATSGEIYDFMMEMMMVDFEEQKELLRSITYGQLTAQDLKTLRLQELDVDGVENRMK